MNKICILLVILSMLLIPVFLVAWIIQAIRKRPAKAIVRVLIVTVAVFIVSTIAAIATACDHQWREATCVMPKTCTKCEATDGEALPHTWVDATCLTPKTCSSCNLTEGECASHSWVDATCTAARTCSVCGLTEGECLPHSWVEASCVDPKTCSACALTEGDALGHDWAKATCTEPKTCSVCGETEGDALGHELGEWKREKKATCTETGLKTAECVNCGEVFEEEIAIRDHEPGKWEVTTRATADEKGQRTRSCENCGEVLETEEYELTPEEVEKEYKASCKSYSYSKIARNPDKYDGKLAVFTGEVVQVQQESYYGLMYYVLRVDVTKSGRYYTDTVYVTYLTTTDAPRILEDDIITMYGELTGEKTYTTVLGASITIPSFSAEYIDIK